MRTSSENVTSPFCNHFLIFQSHYICKMCSNYPGIKLDPRFTDKKIEWINNNASPSFYDVTAFSSLMTFSNSLTIYTLSISYDHRSYERNFSNCVKKPEKVCLDFKSAVQQIKYFIYHFTSIPRGLITTHK